MTGALRVVYPYPIDGLEPGSIQVVERVLHGQPIYGPPTLDFVPLIYGPLYFYAAAQNQRLRRTLRLFAITTTLAWIPLILGAVLGGTAVTRSHSRDVDVPAVFPAQPRQGPAAQKFGVVRVREQRQRDLGHGIAVRNPII